MKFELGFRVIKTKNILYILIFLVFLFAVHGSINVSDPYLNYSLNLDNCYLGGQANGFVWASTNSNQNVTSFWAMGSRLIALDKAYREGYINQSVAVTCVNATLDWVDSVMNQTRDDYSLYKYSHYKSNGQPSVFQPDVSRLAHQGYWINSLILVNHSLPELSAKIMAELDEYDWSLLYSNVTHTYTPSPTFNIQTEGFHIALADAILNGNYDQWRYHNYTYSTENSSLYASSTSHSNEEWDVYKTWQDYIYDRVIFYTLFPQVAGFSKDVQNLFNRVDTTMSETTQGRILEAPAYITSYNNKGSGYYGMTELYFSGIFNKRNQTKMSLWQNITQTQMGATFYFENVTYQHGDKECTSVNTVENAEDGNYNTPETWDRGHTLQGYNFIFDKFDNNNLSQYGQTWTATGAAAALFERNEMLDFDKLNTQTYAIIKLPADTNPLFNLSNDNYVCVDFKPDTGTNLSQLTKWRFVMKQDALQENVDSATGVFTTQDWQTQCLKLTSTVFNRDYVDEVQIVIYTADASNTFTDFKVDNIIFYNETAPISNISRSNEKVFDGNYSIKLNYQPKNPNATEVVWFSLRNIDTTGTNSIRMWIYGDSSNNTLELFKYNTSTTLASETINWSGWKMFDYYSANPNIGQEWQFKIRDGIKDANTTIYIDNLEIRNSTFEDIGVYGCEWELLNTTQNKIGETYFTYAGGQIDNASLLVRKEGNRTGNLLFYKENTLWNSTSSLPYLLNGTKTLIGKIDYANIPSDSFIRYNFSNFSIPQNSWAIVIQLNDTITADNSSFIEVAAYDDDPQLWYSPVNKYNNVTGVWEYDYGLKLAIPLQRNPYSTWRWYSPAVDIEFMQNNGSLPAIYFSRISSVEQAYKNIPFPASNLTKEINSTYDKITLRNIENTNILFNISYDGYSQHKYFYNQKTGIISSSAETFEVTLGSGEIYYFEWLNDTTAPIIENESISSIIGHFNDNIQFYVDISDDYLNVTNATLNYTRPDNSAVQYTVNMGRVGSTNSWQGNITVNPEAHTNWQINSVTATDSDNNSRTYNASLYFAYVNVAGNGICEDGESSQIQDCGGSSGPGGGNSGGNNGGGNYNPPPEDDFVCNEGTSKSCYLSGKEGIQYCYGNAWTTCVTETNCDSGMQRSCSYNGRYGTELCIDGEWSACYFDKVCIPDSIQSCLLGNKQGNQYCLNGFWQPCSIELNYKINVSINPEHIKLTMKKGQMINSTIKITNSGEDPIYFALGSTTERIKASVGSNSLAPQSYTTINYQYTGNQSGIFVDYLGVYFNNNKTTEIRAIEFIAEINPLSKLNETCSINADCFDGICITDEDTGMKTCHAKPIQPKKEISMNLVMYISIAIIVFLLFFILINEDAGKPKLQYKINKGWQLKK